MQKHYTKKPLLHIFHMLYERAFEDGVNWELPQHFSIDKFAAADSQHRMIPPKECPRVYKALERARNVLHKD